VTQQMSAIANSHLAIATGIRTELVGEID